MSAESEMRAVILHAAGKAESAIGTTVSGYPQPVQVTAALALCVGVLRLLASYLAVEDRPRVTAQRDGSGRFAKVDD